MRIGLICFTFTPITVAKKMNIDTQKCQGETSIGVKLSPLHNKRVAAAISPTMAGLKPRNTLCTTLDSIYFKNSLLIKSISIKLGSTKANVAVRLPSIPISSLDVSLNNAVYPQYVALLMPIGPGVICDMARISVNSADVSHWWFLTTSC